MSLLTVSNIYLQIGELKILNGIDFSVRAGERLGIIGPNGSGKTTLFNCISGFNIPNSGTIHFKEKNITNLSPDKRAMLGLGRVFQNFGVFREMTVLENVITALESRHGMFLFPWNESHQKNCRHALECLENFGLAGLASEKAGSLSGGQMRLLEITRAIAFSADLFLLDEPTAGVSPKMKHDVEKILLKLEELKKTVLIIEHDINFIQKLCDRIIVLDVGKIVLDNTPEKVRNDELLKEVYFGRSDSAEGKA